MFILGTSPESCNPYLNCTNGTSPNHGGGVRPINYLPASTCPHAVGGAHIHYSKSLAGPWVSAGPLKKNTRGCNGCGSSNPAPFIFPNGTVLMLGRSKDRDGSRIGHNIWLYRAESWNATYEYVPGNGINGSVNIGDGKLQTEDPVLYKGRRGFHALLHSSPDVTHAWSEDGLSWDWSNTIMGPATQLGGDNERPRVAVDDNGDLAAVFVGQLVTADHDGSRTAAFVPN